MSTADPSEPKATAKQESRKVTGDVPPLVFVSHDSRDAELAEAFSKLLKGVSGGTLKSFRSSDRHGTEGIQYGDEWYKRLMERLSEASDVVCLFTKRSLNRPWILFEAGVAKGKLNTPVHGIALGVQLSEVSQGPFYQFQNCQDDENGLTGLVVQLLERIPNSDPEQEAIGLQVRAFRSSAKDILGKIEDAGHGDDSEEAESSEASAARLFEEMKAMLRDLPVNLEERLSEGGSPLRGRRSRRFHPMMIEEVVHGPLSEDPLFTVLFVSCLLRDDIPWLYELGMEAYRASSGNRRSARAHEALLRFRRAFEFVLRGPLGEEFLMRSREWHMIGREMEHLLDMALGRYLGTKSEAEGRGT